MRYIRHDLRNSIPETGFDVACNIFTSFGYGTEEDDVALFRSLRAAVRRGGRILVETNHRDLMCTRLAHGAKHSMRMEDGTLFLDESGFDPIAGVVTLNWYWFGPNGGGEKHARWRCYTPTEMVSLLQRAGLRLIGTYQGLSKAPYRAEGPDLGGRLGMIALRED